MKRCPSCQQKYTDDAPDYCPNDGMRLVDEEAASFDPERTVMASGLRGGEPLATAPPPSSAPATPPPQQQQQYQAPNEPPGIKPPTQWQPPGEQPQQQQPWQPPGGSPTPQPGWPPQQQAPNWEGASSYQQPGANNAPYAAPQPYAPTQGGRSRALSIAALVTGACAATIMALRVANSRDFFFTSLLVLSILGIGLGVASLILSLQKPSRFGGVPLAIAGLATGTAALVYYLTM
jgi:hypothetical protein